MPSIDPLTAAFVLAATGLLDGERAATHWRYAEALAARHPAVRVDAGVLYVEAGRVLTSAGSAAGSTISITGFEANFTTGSVGSSDFSACYCAELAAGGGGTPP